MKIVIIGGVAAGTSAAAKARRNDEEAVIQIFDRDSHISYSGCGLPYYIGNEVEDIETLVPRDAAFFNKKYNVDVFVRHEVLEISPGKKEIKVRNLDTKEEFEVYYDKLVIATGAKPVIPSIEGIHQVKVFYLRNVLNAKAIHDHIEVNTVKSAVIVGTGFIGLEVAENLANRGIEVTLVEKAPQVMPVMDADMSVYLEPYLTQKGIKLVLDDSVVKLEGEAMTGKAGREKPVATKVTLKSGKFLSTDMVIMAVGVKPEVELAQKAGVALGITGAIQVNTRMQTNIEDIYSCGDCAESFSVITGKPIYRPLGSTANKTGRIAGDQITGEDLEFRGILGTSIFRVFEKTIAQTGLTEKEARAEGYDVVVCHNIKHDKPEYFNGKEMVIKAVADRRTGRMLGAQIIGESGVDKRIDVFVTALTFGAKAEDLFHLDLAYAPPFSTTKDPVMYTGMILENAIHQGRELITPEALKEKVLAGEAVSIIDAREINQYESSHVPGAVGISHQHLRTAADALDKDIVTVTYCNKGVTGNAAQNILINKGFKNVYNLSGGHKHYMSQKNSSCGEKPE